VIETTEGPTGSPNENSLYKDASHVVTSNLIFVRRRGRCSTAIRPEEGVLANKNVFHPLPKTNSGTAPRL
jgi:hypothetical protein